MANTCLYLHETIDILGTGSEAYKTHTGKLGTARTDGGAPLVGTWQQSGSTGTWPTVINLWEMRGWDQWADILERQYTRASGQEPKLKAWWTKATEYRSGGFDRILDPAPFGRIDLVVFRNVLIYMTEQLQERVLLAVHAALNEGGFLVLGKVEGLSGAAKGLFETVNVPERIYQKRMDRPEIELGFAGTEVREPPVELGHSA